MKILNFFKRFYDRNSENKIQSFNIIAFIVVPVFVLSLLYIIMLVLFPETMH
jgi:hypothetical protein